VAENVTVVR